MDNPKEVTFEALREMYSKAEPPLDFDEVLENAEEFDEDWYENHYLDSETQQEIVRKHTEESNLSTSERSKVYMNAITYYGPRGTKIDE